MSKEEHLNQGLNEAIQKRSEFIGLRNHEKMPKYGQILKIHTFGSFPKISWSNEFGSCFGLVCSIGHYKGEMGDGIWRHIFRLQLKNNSCQELSLL